MRKTVKWAGMVPCRKYVAVREVSVELCVGPMLVTETGSLVALEKCAWCGGVEKVDGRHVVNCAREDKP